MCQHNSTKIKEWVNIALKQHDLCDYEIEIEGQTSKGDGYASDIIFIKVTGLSKNGAEKTLDLVAKSSKNSEKLRELSPVKDFFGKEIFLYDKVRPTFQKFQEERGIRDIVDIMPYCYATHMTGNSELLILENLRAEGFQLWDKRLPMTDKHIQLVLEAYGRWHALSIALKAQKPDDYQQLIRNNVNMFSHVAITMKFNVTMWREFQSAKEIAINENESDVLKHLQYSQDDVTYAFTNMFFEDPEYHTILHGDCWNSNFMFKSSDDEANPSSVRIIDWQASSLGSPVFDLSYFIYSCVDTAKNPDAKTLLKTYYDSFSKYLVLLGCDPEKLFPFEKLIEHWKKFSRFGLFLSCLVIRVCLMQSSDLPDFAETADNNQDLTDTLTFEPSKDKVYIQRVRNNFLHYCKNVE